MLSPHGAPQLPHHNKVPGAGVMPRTLRTCADLPYPSAPVCQRTETPREAGTRQDGSQPS